MISIDKKYFKIWYRVYSDRSELYLSNKPSELKMFFSVESYDEKTVENHWNCYVVTKRIFFKSSKKSISNFDSTNWSLEWRLGQNFTFLSFMHSEK